jgi:hypothetical protein
MTTTPDSADLHKLREKLIQKCPAIAITHNLNVEKDKDHSMLRIESKGRQPRGYRKPMNAKLKCHSIIPSANMFEEKIGG